MARRIGVIENPRSQRNKRNLSGLEDAFRGESDLLYRRLEGIETLSALLRDFAAAEVSLLVICGGDGTIQATLTRIFEEDPFATQPDLLLLPRGMTNMTAADVGYRGTGHGMVALLRDALANPIDSRRLRRRRVLRVENPRDHSPQHGLFFGAAGITRAIHACRANVHSLHIEAEAANGLTLVSLLAKWLLGGRRENAVVHGDDITVTVDQGPPRRGSELVVLATTLERLVVGSRPFWDDGSGDFHFTLVGYPPARLIGSLWSLLYGGADRQLPDAYRSLAARRVSLEMTCPFTLDGEIFEAVPGQPVILTAPGEARFLRG